jgi:hypothetical protein
VKNSGPTGEKIRREITVYEVTLCRSVGQSVGRRSIFFSGRASNRELFREGSCLLIVCGVAGWRAWCRDGWTEAKGQSCAGRA